MKKITAVCLFLAGLTASAQTPILHKDYMEMKKNGTLDVTKNYIFTDVIPPSGPPVKYHDNGSRSPSSICSCMIPLDSTFSVVPFVAYGSDPTQTVYGPNHINDDASTLALPLPFSFNFYGVNYNQVFINNNGNISFNTYYSQFTANPFPDASYNMIAPFWADVDTRDYMSGSGGVVYYRVTPTSMVVKWENVGYYNEHFDLRNTFQLIITDGTDPLLPPGKNVGFCYGDMQWTTGDVTGFGGFGSPATVGVNRGNGVDYFQVGTFNYPGTYFDGPYNSPDAVYWLNNQGMYFDVATIGNIPPVIVNNNICDTIDVYTGDTTFFASHDQRILSTDTVHFNIGVSTPEISQNVSAVFTCTADSSHFSTSLLMNTPTYKLYQCTFVAQNLPLGYYYITVNASDDGSPVKTASQTIVVHSIWDPGVATAIAEASAQVSLDAYPNPATSTVTIHHNLDPGKSPVLKVYNSMGQLVKALAITSDEQSVDLADLTAGIYSFVMSDKNGKSKSVRVVKK